MFLSDKQWMLCLKTVLMKSKKNKIVIIGMRHYFNVTNVDSNYNK